MTDIIETEVAPEARRGHRGAGARRPRASR